MALLDRNGPLDTLTALMILLFCSLWFLGFGLGLEFARNAIPSLMTLSGVLPDKGLGLSADRGLAVVGGGAWAFAGIIMTLPYFLGTEGANGRYMRQTFSFSVFLAWTILHIKMTMDGARGGWDSNFNRFWVVFNAVMTYIQYQWVGKDVCSKLKLT